MAALTAQEKLDLIYVNLQEVLKCELIEDIVLKQQRPLKIYWGTSLVPELLFDESVTKLRGHRLGDDRKTALRLFCPDCEDCSVSSRRMHSEDFIGGRPWILR